MSDLVGKNGKLLIDFCNRCPARETCPMPDKEKDWKTCHHKEEMIKNGSWVAPRHNCREYDHIIVCDGETDTWKCRVCGREIKEPCNFDDDMS